MPKRAPPAASVIREMVLIFVSKKYCGSVKTENRDAASLPKKMVKKYVSVDQQMNRNKKLWNGGLIVSENSQ